MKVLVIDGCIRKETSRTWKLADAFLSSFQQRYLESGEEIAIERLFLPEMELQCLKGEFFDERERLLASGNIHHPRFQYAHQFAQADKIVVAAPFWDLSIPAILKVYIENISVEGITFTCNKNGITGMCKASKLLFFTTRGGIYGDGELEHGARYLKALCKMFGITWFGCICAEGIDELVKDSDKIMDQALKNAIAQGCVF